MVGPEGPVGGRATVAGVLYQMFRSLALGCDVVARKIHAGAEGAEAMLTVEPPSGDLRIEGRQPVVEQVKMRRGKNPWSAGEIAEKVMPDLMRAAAEAGELRQAYRFTTDRAEGLGELREFLARLANDPAEDHEQLDDGAKVVRYGRVWHTLRGMYQRLSSRAGAASEAQHAQLWAVLRSLEINVVEEREMVAGTDLFLRILADDRDAVPTLRGKLLADLMNAARTGETVDMARLLELNGLSPTRLMHAARLPGALAQQAGKDAALTGYRPREEAKTSALRLSAAVSILGGESGQGKTWALCRAALHEAAGGRPVIVLPARGTVSDLESEVVKRVWLNSYDVPLPLVTVAKRLRPQLEAADGTWLTVYLDDLHDRDLARALIGADWPGLGIRLVISSQPMIQSLLEQEWDVSVYPVAGFSLPELRLYLEASDRSPSRIPDDVLDWLTRPILAATFVRLPETADWSDPNEYRLIGAYWSFATRRYRNQADHGSDAEGLKLLAGTLLAPSASYPFPTRLRARHFDDEAAHRLTEVGLIRESEEGLSFSHDRLLNWAVASFLADRALDGVIDAVGLADVLDQIDTMRTLSGDPIGNRLSYVLLDLVWLLACAGRATLLSELLLLHARRSAKRSAEERFLGHDLSTIGAPVVPAIRLMLEEPLDENSEWAWRGYLARALRRIGRDSPQVVREAILPLLAVDGPRRVAALNVLRAVAAPEEADLLFQIHLEHARALRIREEDASERYGNHKASFAALLASVKANPNWIATRAEISDDPEELEQLIWLLLNIDQRQALPVWLRFKPKFFAHIEPNSNALLRAIREFLDRDELHRLEVEPDEERLTAAFQIDALARMDATRAVRRLQQIDLDDLWGTSAWWMDGLLHRAGNAARLALRPRSDSRNDPYGVTMRLYRPRIDLLDVETLDIILDELERRLAEPPDIPGDPLDDVWRWLEFVRAVRTPELIDCVHRRRGTQLEKLLADRAGRRQGRTSRYVDRIGDYAREILAMIAGDGFDALAIAELNRSNPYGQEDGLRTALWSDSPAVAAELRRIPPPTDNDQYRAVLLHHALAAHRQDDALALLLASGGLTYNDAVEIRRSRAPMTDEEIAPLRQALARGELEEAKQAVRMSAFAGRRDLFADVVEALQLDNLGARLMDEAIGILRYEGVYDPRLLPLAQALLLPGEKGSFAAGYLAMHGDQEARAAVIDWLAQLPKNELQHRDLIVVDHLLDHPDSERSALEFLRERLWGRGLGRYAGVTVRLAQKGDLEAISAVRSLAFQSPRFGDDHPVQAIRHLAETEPVEAFAAAERLFLRHGEAAAAREMLRLDSKRALPLIVAAYRGASWEQRWWLARLLRWYAPRTEYFQWLGARSRSGDQEDRREAAELCGWLPNRDGAELLSRMTEDPHRQVELAAFEALRRQRMEAAALRLMGQLIGAPRSLAWARLKAIVRLLDPFVLGHAGDPASIAPILDKLPAEFRIEAKRLLDGARKKVENEARKRERDRERD